MKRFGTFSATAFYSTVCLLAAAFIVLAGIVPAHRAMVRTEEQIAAKKRQIDGQQQLYPLLVTLIRDVQQKPPVDVPAAGQPATVSADLEAIEDRFVEIGRRHGVKLVSMAADPTSYLAETDRLRIDLAIEGPFANLGRALGAISALPFLAEIEHLVLEPAGRRRHMELRLALHKKSGKEG